MWQQLELASELESDLRDCELDKKWLVDFNAGKTELVLFDRSNNTGSIDVKMDGSVLEEKSSFKTLGLTFSSKLYSSNVYPVPFILISYSVHTHDPNFDFNQCSILTVCYF